MRAKANPAKEHGNVGRPINSVRNLVRRLSRQDRARKSDADFEASLARAKKAL